MINPGAVLNPAAAHPRAIYRIIVDGNDITASLAGRLVSLSLTDNRGFEADQLDIELDDTDGKLDLPPRGATLKVAIGWDDSGLVEKGSFTVDELGHAGPPDVLTIHARSADLRSGLTTQRERSWHNITLSDLVRTIAEENDLQPMTAPNLAGLVIDHLDQTNESAANLLTRLARQYDAIATVKDGKLLFINAAGGVSASGKPLPAIHITRESGDRHRFSVADREAYTAVRANFNDLDSGEKSEVIWSGAENSAERGLKREGVQSDIAASAENIKTLRHVYANKANAKHAARAEWRRLQRGMATFDITLARGRPEIFPDLPATVSGYKPAIDSTDWIVSKVSHTLNDSGLATAIELEIRATEIAG